MKSYPLISFAWQFVKQQKWTFFFVYLLSLTWAFESTVWPYLLRMIVDTLANNEHDRLNAWATLKVLLGLAICLWVFVEICFRTRDFLRAKAFPQLEAAIRMAMFEHIQHHSPQYFNEHFAGSLSNKISDMTTHITSMLQNLTIFVSAVLSSLLVIFFFSNINPLFAQILAVWICLHMATGLLFISKSVKYSNDHGEIRSHLAGKIVDSFTNNFAVNLFYRFAYEKQKIAAVQEIEKQRNYRVQRYLATMLVATTFIFLVGMISLTTFLLSYWTENKISTGEVIQVLNTTFNISMILWVTCDLLPQFFKSYGIASQALQVMQHPQNVPVVDIKPKLLVKQGEIVFDKVCFNYGTKTLFNNLSLSIKPGEKIGLVGYSGAGKSTFVNLILRFYPLITGKILVDGQDISQVSLESLRSQIALIPQDPLLFHRSLEENLHYGNTQATPEEVREASKKAHCDEFINKTPQGYASLVGERGTKLSGGERQRIAIARAILAASPILILDEATSSLDSITEKFIQEGLEKLMQNRTTLVIAHRLSTLSKMDRILVFDKGIVVEDGSHAKLLEKQGIYARMWHMQAGGFLPDTP